MRDKLLQQLFFKKLQTPAPGNVEVTERPKWNLLNHVAVFIF
jgi:hypothetical protein